MERVTKGEGLDTETNQTAIIKSAKAERGEERRGEERRGEADCLT
jgi:hypothetical protein